jgi:hypothetical protein
MIKLIKLVYELMRMLDDAHIDREEAHQLVDFIYDWKKGNK